MGSYSTSRRPYFKAANESGLASLGSVDNQHALFATRSGFLKQQHQMGYYYSVSSPRSVSARFYDARFEEPQPHFLQSCFLCNKPLANKDIFMYRGDIPFCSEECRQEQIEIDEAKEKNMNLSSSVKALRNKEQKRSSSPTRGQDYSFHTGTINAAA